MAVLWGLVLMVLVGQGMAIPAPQGHGERLKGADVIDPQVLNYHLQQLGLRQDQPQGIDFQQQEQPLQFPTVPQQVPQVQGPDPQDLENLYLQQKLFQSAYQTQINSAQSSPQPQEQQQQELDKQRLLGVAYSSAADASRTSFSGYGIKYSF